MTIDDRNQNEPEEPREGDEPTEPQAEEPTEPQADEPTEPQADEPTEPQPEGPTEPLSAGPEDPTREQPRGDGPQAPAGQAAGTGGGPGARAQRRLMRSRENRVIGGVCGGLGRYFNTDPVIFRIGAIALAFVGGAGVLLYLAALLLMPSDSGSAPVGQRPEGRNRALVIAGVVVLLLIAWPFLLGGGFLLAGLFIPLAILVGAGVLVWWLVSGEGPSGDARDVARRAALGIGVLIACGIIWVAGAFATAAGPDWVVAALVIVAGGAILAGAFLKPVRWLILPAVTLALAAGTVSAAGLDLDGGAGEREYRPASVVDLRDRYELGIGELVIDLRDTDLPAGDVPLGIDLGLGEARVIVPDDVCVATSADVGMGNVNLFGRDNGGIDVDFDDTPDAAPDRTRLVLDAEIGVGELRVTDQGDDEFYHREDFGPFDGGDNDLDRSDPNRVACAATGERANG
jgi:phage shock protein PspC (stress-responsive transcriptional regulator)